MSQLYDVAVIGGGPSGLSAALNAASEGLDTALLCSTMGGQAGTSSKIENYLGFPAGISGPALTERARKQAEKFGTVIKACSVEAVARNADGNFVIATHGGEIIRAKTVIVATGAAYNRLPKSANVEPFEGKGVHYACTAQTVKNRPCKHVAVVGGGNSAGQAAMFLADRCEHVHLVVRRSSLRDTMSDYLLRRIEAHPSITVHYGTEVMRVNEDPDHPGTMQTVMLQRRSSGEAWLQPITDLFIMIGAKPNSAFLAGLADLDKDGFVKTDGNKATSVPGLYAVGDVRAGSVKRVANAVGEGATCIPHVWGHINPSPDEEAA